MLDPANFEKLYEKMGSEVNFIEDAAQAFGVKFNDENVGQIGLAGCISFHPTKNIHLTLVEWRF